MMMHLSSRVAHNLSSMIHKNDDLPRGRIIVNSLITALYPPQANVRKRVAPGCILPGDTVLSPLCNKGEAQLDYTMSCISDQCKFVYMDTQE